ncbi:MAG: C_GCAxxG_C_C family protein [Bacteroidales bacterium]|nr:C_GCAxxG_C_C family protein [Bacteroidales bacterium]
MTKKESAAQTFMTGYNCAQSVFSAFTDYLKLDRETALSISSGFGAGMGRTQATCGAVTGAIMVIGSRLSGQQPSKEGINDYIYSKTREFINQFTERNKTTNCRELVHADLNTEEGRNYFEKNNIFNEVCMKCVSDAIDILEEIL